PVCASPENNRTTSAQRALLFIFVKVAAITVLRQSHISPIDSSLAGPPVSPRPLSFKLCHFAFQLDNNISYIFRPKDQKLLSGIFLTRERGKGLGAHLV